MESGGAFATEDFCLSTTPGRFMKQNGPCHPAFVFYLNDSAKPGEGARKGDFLVIGQIFRLVAISKEMSGNLGHSGIGQ
ncbi:MAG: hypothetical protein ACKO5E_05640 [bacterium]